MKRLLCVLLMLTLSVPAFAFGGEDLTDLEGAVSGVLANLMDAMLPYPSADEPVSDEYATSYLFYMANIYYGDDPVILPAARGYFDQYVGIPADEAALMLKWAFGSLYGLDDLPDGDVVFLQDDTYYTGYADGFRLEARYAGDQDVAFDPETPYPFAYTRYHGDGGETTGEAQVWIDETGDEDAPYCVAGISRDVSGDVLFGNWKAGDGYWFSLMEEGLAFFFDDQYELIGSGDYARDGEKLVFHLDGDEIEAAFDGLSIELTLDGVTRKYQPELCM